MRLKGLISFTVLTIALIQPYSFAAEPIMGDTVNKELIAQVEAENAKLDSDSTRLPASVEESEEPKN